MNPLDIVAILLVVLATILGFRSGAFPQLGGLLGAIAGGAIVILLLPAAADPLDGLDPLARPFVVIAALIAAVAVGEAVGSGIGRRIAGSLGTGVLGAADRVFGAFVGAAQALLILWLIGGLAAVGPVPRLSEAAQTSAAIRSLNAILPPATEIAAGLGEAIGTSGLPDVFVGFEPLPAPPVDRPSDVQAARIGRLAEAATYRVEAATCGLESTGTGFKFAPDYVLTNAHVVAGANPQAHPGASGPTASAGTRVSCCSIRSSTWPSCSSPMSPGTRCGSRRMTRSAGRPAPRWGTRAAAA